MSEKKPVLLTGAAGALGTALRPMMLERYGALRSSDIADFGPALPGEEIVKADLADAAAIDKLVEGTRSIVHFGGVSTENTFDKIMHGNFRGTFNIYEAARKAGVKRIVFASSNHAIGYHPITQRLDNTAVHRPDTIYGVSKAYGEDLGRYFVEKFGLEIACLRIGSALPKPENPRHLSTWLSHGDLMRLIAACLDAEQLDFAVLYGASKNTRGWWDNSKQSNVKYEPQDDAEVYAAEILKDGDKRDPKANTTSRQGGPYCDVDYVFR